MAVIEGGTTGVLADVGVAAASPLHVSGKPIPYGSLGHYGISLVSGVMAAGLAANSPIAIFRYTGGNLCAVTRVLFDASVAGTAFAAGVPTFGLMVARAFTALTTSGTVATLTGNNNKLRTSMATTGLGTFEVCTTAALTAGTWVLDAQEISRFSGVSGTATTGQIVPPGTRLFESGGDIHPLLLTNNEGWTVRATVPATGTWAFTCGVLWAEVTAY